MSTQRRSFHEAIHNSECNHRPISLRYPGSIGLPIVMNFPYTGRVNRRSPCSSPQPIEANIAPEPAEPAGRPDRRPSNSVPPTAIDMLRARPATGRARIEGGRTMAKKRNESSTQSSNESDDCAHYWQIASPSGSTSRGICKRCGETREFFNSAQALAEARAASG